MKGYVRGRSTAGCQTTLHQHSPSVGRIYRPAYKSEQIHTVYFKIKTHPIDCVRPADNISFNSRNIKIEQRPNASCFRNMIQFLICALKKDTVPGRIRCEPTV